MYAPLSRNFFNLAFDHALQLAMCFCQCNDKVANLLTSVLLELKSLIAERRSSSFTNSQTNLLEKGLLN